MKRALLLLMRVACAIPDRVRQLAGWIVDSETIKPGNAMPINSVNAKDLQALLAFVRSLR